jgi:hypothetical protein
MSNHPARARRGSRGAQRREGLVPGAWWPFVRHPAVVVRVRLLRDSLRVPSCARPRRELRTQRTSIRGGGPGGRCEESPREPHRAWNGNTSEAKGHLRRWLSVYAWWFRRAQRSRSGSSVMAFRSPTHSVLLARSRLVRRPLQRVRGARRGAGLRGAPAVVDLALPPESVGGQGSGSASALVTASTNRDRLGASERERAAFPCFDVRLDTPRGLVPPAAARPERSRSSSASDTRRSA